MTEFRAENMYQIRLKIRQDLRETPFQPGLIILRRCQVFRETIAGNFLSLAAQPQAAGVVRRFRLLGEADAQFQNACILRGAA